MDGGHQGLNDTEFVVDNLGERCKAVRRARSIGDLRYSQNLARKRVGQSYLQQHVASHKSRD